MIKSAVKLTVVCLLFAILCGQASPVFAYQSCDDSNQDGVYEHIDTHVTSGSTSDNECCDEDCCPPDCLCAECLSMLGGYLAVNTHWVNQTYFSDSIDVVSLALPTSRSSSLYRPPISIS